MAVYEEYNRDTIEYFNKYAPEKLFHTSLDDIKKWKKLGNFLGIDVADNYNVHANKTKMK